MRKVTEGIRLQLLFHSIPWPFSVRGLGWQLLSGQRPGRPWALGRLPHDRQPSRRERSRQGVRFVGFHARFIRHLPGGGTAPVDHRVIQMADVFRLGIFPQLVIDILARTGQMQLSRTTPASKSGPVSNRCMLSRRMCNALSISV